MLQNSINGLYLSGKNRIEQKEMIINEKNGKKRPEYVVNMMEEILMKEKTSMYKEFLVLDGTIENVEELNKAVEAETGCTEFFDTESEEWRGWVEYRDGKTIILSEEA